MAAYKRIVLKLSGETLAPENKSGSFDAARVDRAAQAIITCAKVRALMNGKYNISYADIDALACPVLRHRIKINYTAVNDKLKTDDVIEMIVKGTKKGR